MAEKGIEKVTIMVLKVDLQCSKCYKKVKKVLCKFPQIRDQMYDEKANTVTIKVVCCSPEKIMDKLCYKGNGAIKTIKTIEPGKPKEVEKPKAPEKPKEPEKPKTAEKPKEPEKPKTDEKPKEPEKPKTAEKPKEPEKPKAQEKPKEPEKPKQQEGKPSPNTAAPPPKQQPVLQPQPGAQPGPPKQPQPQPGPPLKQPQPGMVPGPGPMPGPQAVAGQPMAMCWEPSYNGYGYGGGGGGQWVQGYGVPAQAPAPYYECYGRPVYDSWGSGGSVGGGGGGPYRHCHPNKCDYFSEENPQSCSIM